MEPDPSAELPELSEEFLGRYEILSRLGHGGMAFVLEARQKNLDRRVAIKLLRLTDDFEEEDIERLVREGRMLAKLRHPRILEVFDAGYDGSTPYMVAELVPGESLAAQVERGRLPLKRALEIVVGVADALAFAHDHGITHRDVKPENILLLPDGELKLADFGLARQTAGGARLTQVGMIIGTPSYMSPEQIVGPTIGPESDQYALGIVAYELAVGVLPFTGESPIEKAFARIREDAIPPRRLSPHLPASVDALIVQALQRDPARRFLTMAHLREAARKALERLGAAGEEAFVPMPRGASKVGFRRTATNAAVDPNRSATVALSTIHGTGHETRFTRAVPRDTRSVPSAEPEAGEPIDAEAITTGTALEPPRSAYRQFAFGAVTAALAVGAALALLAPSGSEVAGDRSSVIRRTVRLVPRPGLSPAELAELDRDGEKLVVRLKTDVPLALVAAQERAGTRTELGREAAPALEHAFALDPARTVEGSTLSLGTADGSAEPLAVELAGLRVERRKLKHRLERAKRTDVLRDVLDEWDRAGEPAARKRVEKLAEEARGRTARLVALAPFLLDCAALPLPERRFVYDELSELRVLDRFLISFGQPTLDAQRALGRTFSVSAPTGDLAKPRVAGGAVPKLAVRVTTVSVHEESDMLAGDLGAAPTSAMPLATSPKAAGRATLEVAMPMLRAADLLWIRVAGWRLLVTAECARERVRLGQPALFYHGVDPALLGPSNELGAEIDQLPSAIAALPVAEVGAALLVWPK